MEIQAKNFLDVQPGSAFLLGIVVNPHKSHLKKDLFRKVWKGMNMYEIYIYYPHFYTVSILMRSMFDF